MPNFCKNRISSLERSVDEMRESLERLHHLFDQMLNRIEADYHREENQEGAVGNAAGVGVYWGPGDQRNVRRRLPGIQTNDRAQIHAAIIAINQARDGGYRSVVINTDSMFLISSVTTWLPIWRANDWMLPSGEEVPNKDDFQELDDAMDGIEVKWVHVQGNPGIQEAGALANAGAAE